MKKVVLFALAAILAIGAAAQSTDKATKKEQRAQAKLEAQKLMDSQHNAAINALDLGSFTIHFDRWYYKNGNLTSIEPRTNFLSVNNGRAVLQMIFNPAKKEANLLGGNTFDLSVSSISKKKTTKGSINYQLSLTGATLSCTALITLSKKSNIAHVELIWTFGPNRYLFQGTVLPFKQSGISVGRHS